MTDTPTIRDILDEFAFNGHTKMGLTDKQYERQLIPAEQAINALISTAVREARIDEIENLTRYVELRQTADGATISAHYLYRQTRKRIAQLKEEQK
jgi:hypothetical protein